MKKLILVILFIAMSISPVYAGDGKLTWDAPTLNEDGTPVTDLAGYVVFQGQISGVYTNSTTIGNVTEYAFTNLSGNNCFVVRAYDTSGNVSDPSNETCTDMDNVAPGNPTNNIFKVIIKAVIEIIMKGMQ